MLGFSIQKLMVLVAIIGAVWYAFKFVGRLQETREAQRKAGAAAARRSGGLGDTIREWAARQKGGGAADAGQAEDMAPCPKCGAYVAARGATSCGRSDCPY